MNYIVLFKVLYFAEREQYATYGQHLIEDTFVAMEKGPVPSYLYDSVKNAIGISRVNRNTDIISNAIKADMKPHEIKALEKPDMDELSAAEIDALDNSYKTYAHLSVDEISKLSHDTAWTDAWTRKHNSDISSIKIAEAGGASKEFLEYINQSETLNAYFEI